MGLSLQPRRRWAMFITEKRIQLGLGIVLGLFISAAAMADGPLGGGGITLGSAPALSGTCTTGSEAGNQQAGKFTATCSNQTVIITFSAVAPNGYICLAQDETTSADLLKQTGHTLTSCTLTGTTAANDVIVYHSAVF